MASKGPVESGNPSPVPAQSLSRTQHRVAERHTAVESHTVVGDAVVGAVAAAAADSADADADADHAGGFLVEFAESGAARDSALVSRDLHAGVSPPAEQ